MNRLITATLTFILTSCSATLADETSTVHFSIGREIECKAEGISEEDEKGIDHWAVIAFNSNNGDEVLSATAMNGADISLTVRSGVLYRAYAVVNYPRFGEFAFDPAGITDEATLMAFPFHLADYTPSSLPMFGETAILANSESASSVVQIRRMVSKIAIRKISLDMREERFRALPFTLCAMYLTNVWCLNTPGADASVQSSPTSWYNAMMYHGSGTNSAVDALVADRNINVAIAQGESYDIEHSFYAMPNGVSQDNDVRSDGWAPRCTRLVIEAIIGNRTYYYPITLPGMKRGYSYMIKEVTIRSLGSLDPELEVPGAVDIQFNVTVPGAWTGTYSISENS